MSNIQVVVRCRGRNSRELQANSQVVVELPSDIYSLAHPTVTINQHHSNVLSQKIINSLDSKTYNFDQVYGPMADQQLVYQKAVMPLVRDFFNGFNVTVLAYGQTGTGKTYTMCGDGSGTGTGTASVKNTANTTVSSDSSLSEHSGIIPRVLHDLFARLDQTDDFIVKCSFIELYNENLKDLLNDEPTGPSTNNGSSSGAGSNSGGGLRIYETKKSANSILISNLKEVNIDSLTSGSNLLKSGLQKRKIASTKLNDVSSRSHTIFTINLYKRQTSTSGLGELVRHSKINLVDLAGLENINKSGSINQRAKEAGSINQSLLTLGRVINSLSDKSTNANHVPYRESKLTRLLQDSIGGKTKTCLISTISPAKINLEETLSTLEYSLKVKNIENKPQLGQDFNIIMKEVLIKELSTEIIKLNNDLMATRMKNGIYMNEANYNNLIEQNSSQKQEIDEMALRVKMLTERLHKYEREMESQAISGRELQKELSVAKEAEVGMSNQLESINESIRLINEGIIAGDGHGASDGLLPLAKTLTSNLNVLKLNFHSNYQKVSTDLSTSIKQLPEILNNLIKTSGQNGEQFGDFKTNQNEIHHKLQAVNTNFQQFLLNDTKLIGDLQPLIDQFVKENVNKQLAEFKNQLRSDFTQMMDSSITNLEGGLNQSINNFSSSLVTNKVNQITKEAQSSTKQTEQLVQKSVQNLTGYETKLMESHNNQGKLIQNISKQFIDNNLSNKLTKNLSQLSSSFEIDNQNVMKVLPDFNKVHQSQMAAVQTREEQLGRIKSQLAAVQRSPSPHKFQKSPLKHTNQNVTRSPTKSPGLRSPDKKSPNKNGFKSKIPTLDKENAPDLKKRRINDVS